MAPVKQPTVSRVFVGPKGATPRRSNFARAWSAALSRARVKGTPVPDGLHFHDLRHTANGFESDVASLKELMARMGHSTTRAALIYQRAQRDHEREIADAVSATVEAELARNCTADEGDAGRLGTGWARGAALRSIVRAIWPASGPGPIGAPGSQV